MTPPAPCSPGHQPLLTKAFIYQFTILNLNKIFKFSISVPFHIVAAVDRDRNIARNAFEIRVQHRPTDMTINHEFTVRLDADYRGVMQDVNQRVAIASQIASAFGDREKTHNMAVIR